LAYLGFDVLIAGIEIAEMPLESIDIVKREVAFTATFGPRAMIIARARIGIEATTSPLATILSERCWLRSW
jgi:hypothetical protein